MSDFSFYRFYQMYVNGQLAEDITYRGYDLEAEVSDDLAINALKSLGYWAGELAPALAAVRASYQINNTRDVLAMWWLWHCLSTGKRKRAKLRETDYGQD